MDLDDYDKVGIDTGGAVYRNIYPTVQGVWYGYDNVTADGGATHIVFHVEVTFASDAVTLAGAPQVAWVSVKVPLSKFDASIGVTVQAFNKTATRLPEAMFLRFKPAASGDGGHTFAMEKLGEWMDPLDVVVGGAKHMHSLSRGGVSFPAVASSSGSNRMNITSPDARTFCWGAPTGFPVPTDEAPDMTQGGSHVLWDNLWCVGR